MRVTRLGRVFVPAQGSDWMASHAAYPTPLLVSPDRLRIFFNTRDADNRGSVGWVDVDSSDPLRIRDCCRQAALGPGPLGSFDDRGISNGSVHRVGNEIWLYYMGWNKSADVPFRNAIGLAVSRDADGAKFERRFQGPLVDRSRFDPFTISYPFVVPGRAGVPWSMYYGTNRAGGDREDNMQHALTEATSDDGISWRPSGRDAIGLQPGEFGLSRPWELTLGGNRVLLFSVRRSRYTIGVAKYDRGNGTWVRTSDNLLGPSREDWDSDATCYASVISLAGTRYMFYCGNGYGRTGFGVAVLED